MLAHLDVFACARMKPFPTSSLRTLSVKHVVIEIRKITFQGTDEGCQKTNQKTRAAQGILRKPAAILLQLQGLKQGAKLSQMGDALRVC